MKKKNKIHVPALEDGGEIIISAFSIGDDIKFRTKGGHAFSVADYQKLGPPTAAELVYAFFGKDMSGEFVSPAYRSNVLSRDGCGEWTSTLIENGRFLIERPEHIVHRNGSYAVEGGRRQEIELPSNGWVLEYDPRTGLPLRTSEAREEAAEIFGDYASFFYVYNRHLGAVLRSFVNHNFGPFYLSVGYRLDDHGENSGYRPCVRDASRE